jgi:hypothetical protein
MEGGGGSPGISYDPIVQALAAAGRRACWYDRLGYGWSDDSILPTTTDRVRQDFSLSILGGAGKAVAPHNTNYQLPNGLIKVRRRWGQCHHKEPTQAPTANLNSC